MVLVGVLDVKMQSCLGPQGAAAYFFFVAVLLVEDVSQLIYGDPSGLVTSDRLLHAVGGLILDRWISPPLEVRGRRVQLAAGNAFNWLPGICAMARAPEGIWA